MQNIHICTSILTYKWQAAVGEYIDSIAFSLKIQRSKFRIVTSDYTEFI